MVVGETVQMIGSTIIRPPALPAQKGGAPGRGLGCSRGDVTTKIHLRMTGAGLPRSHRHSPPGENL